MVQGWTFFSNHGHVLVCLAQDPASRIREVAAAVGITERAVQHIIKDLVAGGYVTKEKVGRRNAYQLARTAPLRHPLEAAAQIGTLTDLFVTAPSGPGRQ